MILGRIFGTDGVRGIANEKLDVELALAISRAAGMIIKTEGVARPKILVGRDTRLSGEMLQCAVAAGLSSVGCDVELLGVVPTPAVAYLVKRLGANGGVMITASHNPFMYNGIKYFGGDGFKLTDAQEDRIERIILDGEEPIEFARTEHIGTVHVNYGAVEIYEEHIASAVKHDLSALRIAVDCANGAASATAEALFCRMGADAVILHQSPDGTNINAGCGSTHIEGLQELVRSGNFAAGAAFDGDADRCLMVDETGELIDGDHLIGLLAEDMKRHSRLKGGVVGTILTNLGLHAFLEERQIPVWSTRVGDRYVLEAMREKGWNIGGEQSGHVILSDYATTGDGQLTAVQFLCALKASGAAASQLNRRIESFPQVSINVPVANDRKHQVAALPAVEQVGREIAEYFGGQGRVVIRPSGTEPKVRVMVEGRDPEQVQQQAQRAAQVVKAAVEAL